MIAGARKSSFSLHASDFASAMETCGGSLTCALKMEEVGIDYLNLSHRVAQLGRYQCEVSYQPIRAETQKDCLHKIH